MENDKRTKLPSSSSFASARPGNNGARLPSSTQRSALSIPYSERPGSPSSPAMLGPSPTPQVRARRSRIPSISISHASDSEGDLHLNSSDMKMGFGKGLGLGFDTRLSSAHHHPGDADGAFGSMFASSSKRKMNQFLSLRQDRECDGDKQFRDECHDSSHFLGASTWKRRAASMPEPSSKTLENAQMDIWHQGDSFAPRSCLASGSPPIVDFTRFEDRYRGSGRDYDGLLTASRESRSDAGKGKDSPSFRFGGSKGRIQSDQYVGDAKIPTNSIEGHDSDVKMTSKIYGPIGNLDGARMRESGCGGVEMINGGVDGSTIPASERKPDPRLVVDSLYNVLGTMANVRQFLDVDDLAKMHEDDRKDFGAKLRSREVGHKSSTCRDEVRIVFGQPIRKVSMYASTTMILGEREHELPIVVVHCIEELYRTGIYQPNLFRTLPNRLRLLELISIFDSEEQLPGSVIRSRRPSSTSLHSSVEGFGAATSLHLELTSDICALLTSYLSALPEPILSPYLFETIWKLCGIQQQPQSDTPELRQYQEGALHPTRLCSIPLTRSYTPPSEATYILAAQHLLHLLPSPNFSLLIYLLAFFSQVALVREENGVGVEDLSRMFGARLFGHGHDVTSSSKSELPSVKGREKGRDGRGETMMVWFLRRWGPISETLFDISDAQSGVLHQNRRMQQDKSGRDASTSAHVVARHAISSHQAVEDELEDGQVQGGYQEVEGQVQSVLFDNGDADIPEPERNPLTPHVKEDIEKCPIPSPVEIETTGLNLLCYGRSDSSPSSLVSQSSSTLSQYLPYQPPLDSSKNFNPADTDSTGSRSLQALSGPGPVSFPNIRVGDDDGLEGPLHHSSPRKNFHLDFRKGSAESIGSARDGGHSRATGDPTLYTTSMGHLGFKKAKAFSSNSDKNGRENSLGVEIPEKVYCAEGENDSEYDQESFSKSDIETPNSLIFNERLLDISMPNTILELDETLPTSVSDDRVAILQPSSFSSASSPYVNSPLTPRPGCSWNSPTNCVGDINAVSTKVDTYSQKKRSNLPLGSLPSHQRIASVSTSKGNNTLGPPPRPTKSPERGTRRLSSQTNLGLGTVSRSLLRSPNPTPSLKGVVSESGSAGDAQEVIDALKRQLAEVKEERKEAWKFVCEVKRLLGKFRADEAGGY